MINVSNEFKRLMDKKTDFKENAEITFANGTVINLTEKDFTVSNNGIVDASETNGIPLGVTVCRSIQIELMNDDDRFSEYDFFGARIRLYLTFQLSKTVERIEYGTFTVLTPETYGTTVIITALDDIHKADKPYTTSLTFPVTVKSMLVDACSTLGISLGTTSFVNDSFIVQSAPSGITYRQLIGYIAMIAGGNARIDTTGRLRIISYDFKILDNLRNIIDGGFYKPWDNLSNLDGGSYLPWNLGDVADGGTFGDRELFHVLSSWNNLKVDTDDVVITGIQTTFTDNKNNEQTVKYGTDGYVLKIENPLFVGKEQESIKLIGNMLIGGKFRQFSGDLISNPTCEFMDYAIVVDRKGNAYPSFLTDINFQFFGFTSIKNSAEPALRNSATNYSDATKSFVAARKLVENEKNAREIAVEQLARDLKKSSGLFMTEEKQLDGSKIYYMHDKPTLSESKVVWKLTALAFGISTDGGKTYPYGFTVNGETVTRLLYAEGINADYINTGNLIVGDNQNPNGKIITKSKTDAGNILTVQLHNGQLQIYSNNILIGFIAPTTSGPVFASNLKSLGLGTYDSENNKVNTYYYLNNGLNPNGLEERHLFNGLVRFLNNPRMSGLYLMDSNVSLDESKWVRLYRTDYDGTPSMAVNGGIYAYGSIGCSGQKYRIVDTENYGKRGMNAFETAEAYFSDIGSSVIGDDGTVTIEFDSIYAETIDTDKPYQVQTTQTSNKSVSWLEKKPKLFIVHGEPGATFDWMLMCKQKGYADVRMQEIIIQEEKNDD